MDCAGRIDALNIDMAHRCSVNGYVKTWHQYVNMMGIQTIDYNFIDAAKPHPTWYSTLRF